MVKRVVSKKIQFFSGKLGLDLSYFLRGGAWLGISLIISTAGGIFLSSLFSRIWPKDVYGQFSFLMSSLGFMSLFTLSGMTEAVFQGSIENKDGIFKRAVKKVFLASLVGALVLIAGSAYFFFRDNTNLSLAVLFSALAFPFSALGSLSISFYKGKKNFRLASIMSTGANLFSIVMTAIALFWFGSLVAVALFSAWSTAIINIFFVLKNFKNLKNDKSDKRLLKYGVFMSFTNFIWVGLDYTDRFFIPLLLGFEKNAIYAFAIFIPNQIQGFFKIFITLGQPKITAISDRHIKKALIVKSLYLEALIAVIVVCYIIASPHLFRVLYPDYGDSIFLSQIFSLSLLYFPNTLFGSFLTKRRLIRESVAGTFIYAALSFLSLLLFIYLWGLIGAVISKIFSRVLQVIITQFIFFRELRKNKAAPV